MVSCRRYNSSYSAHKETFKLISQQTTLEVALKVLEMLVPSLHDAQTHLSDLSVQR